MDFSESIGKAFDRLLDGCAWVGCALLGFQVVSVSVEIFSRSLFDVSFSVVTPLNEWSLVFLTFLCVAWLQREGGHTSDDSIVRLLPPRLNLAARWLGWLVALAGCALLTWYGTIVTWENFSQNNYDYFKLQSVPLFYVYWVIPAGSLLWLIQLLRRRSRPGSSATPPQDRNGGEV